MILRAALKTAEMYTDVCYFPYQRTFPLIDILKKIKINFYT
jgi:hypothetical protein